MKSETINELALALSEAQAEFALVQENKINPFFKSGYADLGAVIQSAKPVLAKHGLSLSQLVCGSDGQVGITTLLMHKSGQWLESTVTLPVVEEKGKSVAQVAGSIVTYLRRYAYSSTLGLYADEDTDGASGNKPTDKPKAVVPQATNDPAKLVAKAQAIKSKAYDAMLEEFKTIRAEIKVRDESKWVQYKGNDIDTEEKLAPLLQLQKEILGFLS